MNSSTLEIILNSTERDLHEFMDDIPHILTTNSFEHGFHNEEMSEDKSQALFNKFSTSSVGVSKVCIDNTKEVVDLESKCEELSIQVEQLMREKESAHEEIKRLKDQILSQSTYCASLGAVLSKLTWNASSFPQIVDTWILTFQNKIREFLSIVNGCFDAFVSTYKAAFPPTSNAEYQLVVGLLGTFNNLTASPEGREFLITNACGTEFVQKIIRLTPELPLDTGSSSMKRLLLMILYNVSVNKTGLQCLLESRVGDTLSHCLRDKSSVEEIQLLCLRVLESVTYDLIEPRYIQELTAAVPIEVIEILVSSNRADISDTAKLVAQRLQDCQKIIK